MSIQVQEDPRAGIAWVSGEGQLYCVSKGFMALLGYSFRDMQRKIQAIGEAQLRVCKYQAQYLLHGSKTLPGTADSFKHIAGANDDLEQQMVIANQKCTQFFVTMRKDREKALLSPPFEFEVCITALVAGNPAICWVLSWPASNTTIYKV